jgi:hypothetical protein
MSMQRIFIVRHGDIVEKIPVVMPWLVKMVEWTEGRRTADDIVRRLLNMECVLWITLDESGKPNGALVTQVEEYPRMRMLHVLHCAGETGQMDGVADQMYEALDQFAKFNRCVGVELIGRPGWKKHVEPRGYKLKAVTFEKRFEGVLT